MCADRFLYFKPIVKLFLTLVLTLAIGCSGGGSPIAPEAGPKVEILQIVPGSAPVGATVEIVGGPFGSSATKIKVSFSPGVPSTVLGELTGSSFKTIVPNGAVTGPVTVEVEGKSPAEHSAFVVIKNPILTSFEPKEGPPGTEVTLEGFNFGSSKESVQVLFAGTPASVKSVEAKKVVAIAPKTGNSGPITVKVNEASVTTTQSFHLITDPVISSFAPLGGEPGTLVSIKGYNLAETSEVSFGGIGAPLFAINGAGTEIGVAAPGGGKTGAITLTVSGKPILSKELYSFPPILDLDEPFTPDVAKPGAKITLSGQNLGSDPKKIQVLLGNVDCPIIEAQADQSQVVFQVGAGATTGIVKLFVTTPAGILSAQSEKAITIVSDRFFLSLNGDDTISAFNYDGKTGKLSHNGFYFIGQQGIAPGGATAFVSAKEKFLYVLNSSSKTLGGFSVNPQTGSLSSLGGPLSAGTNPVALFASHKNNVLYVLDAPVSQAGSLILFEYGSDDGHLAPLDTDVKLPGVQNSIVIGVGVNQAVLHPSGDFLYVTRSTVDKDSNLLTYSIDSSGVPSKAVDGSGELIPSPEGYFSKIAVNDAGTAIYAFDIFKEAILSFAVDPQSGALTASGKGSPASSKIESIHPHPSGKFVLTADGSDLRMSLYSVVPNGSLFFEGSFSSKGTAALPSKQAPAHLSFDSSGTFVYASLRVEGSPGLYGIGRWVLDPEAKTLSWLDQIRTRSSPVQTMFFAGELVTTNDAKQKFLYVLSEGDSLGGMIGQYQIQTDGKFPPLPLKLAATNPKPTSILVDRDSRYVYITWESANQNLAVFRIADGNDPSQPKGSLEPTGDIYDTVPNPVSTTMDPNGKFLYVAGTIIEPGLSPKPSIRVFRIEDGGNLSSVSSLDPYGVPAPAVLGELTSYGITEKIVISPSGDYLFHTMREHNGAGAALNAYKISSIGVTPADGSLMLSGNGIYAGVSVSSAALGGSFAVHSSGNYALIAPNPGTPNLVRISAYTIDANGSMVGKIDNDVKTKNAQEGPELGANPAGIALHPSGKSGLIVSKGSKLVFGFSINENQVDVQNNPDAALFLADMKPTSNFPVFSGASPGEIVADWELGIAFLLFNDADLSKNVVLSYPIDVSTGAITGSASLDLDFVVKPKAAAIANK